jgi:anti-sigma factor RsiW
MIGSDRSVSEFLHQARFRIDHRWAPRHMSPLIDGELARSQRARMERHTRECPDCRRLLGSLQRMVGALQALPAVGGGGHALQIAAAVRLRLDEPPATE